MGLFGRIFNRSPAQTTAVAPRPTPPAQRQHRQVRARFDSQFTTDENRQHWAMADAMSIDASASWMVRRTLRMRSRYEYHNNGYFIGIVDTIANYCIGTGPRLQMQTKNKDLNAKVEKLWGEWAKEVRLAQTLHSNRCARLVNGESFDLMRSNPNLDSPIKLDVFAVECDQVSSPLFGMYPSQYPDQYFDGVVLDPWGKPERYHVLKQHPGAFGAFVVMGYEFEPWPARYVLHDYKRIREGQQRGVPESVPALPLFANLRRYDLAVIGAAETAADYPMVIQTDGPADGPDEIAAQNSSTGTLDTFQLRARMATVLPMGWKAAQMKAEQPTTNYEQYCNAVLRQVARCMNIPLMFVTLDAQSANMSSAYIITQPFVRSVQVDRTLHYEPMLDRILDEFLTEAIHVEGLLPKDIPDDLTHTWRWPRIGQHADPMKVATAQQTMLAAGTTSIPQLCAEEGLDWEETQASAAASFGMTVQDYQAALREKTFAVRGQPTPATLLPEPKEAGEEEETVPEDAEEEE